jgi:hypothetical protein
VFTAAGGADRLAVMRRSRRGASLSGMTHDDPSLTRRQVLAGAGGTGLLVAAAPVSILGSARPASAASDSADGTPEQIHLTWGADPATNVTVSWASSAPAVRPRVILRPGPGGRPGRIVPATARTGNPPIEPGTSFYIRGYSGGAQTAWLKRTLAAARRDPSIDWIIAQMHQIACSSSATGNGSDLGLRQAWLRLFDRYQVDLVLSGHDHDYERSFPCRGFDAVVGTEVATGAPVQTMRPHPVTTEDSGVFDTSQGTVHLVLGCGRTDANLDDYGVDTADGMRQAKVFTKPNRPVATLDAGRLHPARRGRRRGRPVVGQAGHLDRLRDRGVRRGPGRAGRDDQHQGHALPRSGRRPGQPGDRRGRRAHARLHRIRDVHPRAAPLGPLRPHPGRAAAGRDREQRLNVG